MQNKIWKLKPQINQREFHQYPEIHPVLLQLLFDRNIQTKEAIDNFLNPDYADLLDPFLIKDMRKSVERVWKALENKETIFVYGDYDADGVSGAVIVYNALQKLSYSIHSNLVSGLLSSEEAFENIQVYIPDRAKEGYGLNSDAVKYILQKEAHLVISIDCGVSNLQEIAFLQDSKVDVIVIDHHSIPKILPPAFGLIIPKRKDDYYTFKDLCGAGLAFKFVCALLLEAKFKGQGDTIPEGFEKWFLDFTAVGTIADMVPLLGENRILVTYGLYVLAKTQNLGMKTLLSISGIKTNVESHPTIKNLDKSITVHSVGFQIAPRINAAGRIDHANRAFELFKTKKGLQAKQLAIDLIALNDERKKLTQKIMKEVELRLEAKGEAFTNSNLIFEGDSSWPIGVLGIIAGRLVEKYHKPAFIYQQKGHINAGSARSIEGIHLAEALNASRQYLVSGGGHAGAAGFSFQDHNSQSFKESLLEFIHKAVGSSSLVPSVWADIEVKPQDISWELYDQIDKMAPFGMANAVPRFLIKRMIIKTIKAVGEQKDHLQLLLQPDEGGLSSGQMLKGIGFNLGYMAENLYSQAVIDIIFELDVNEWAGNRELQLHVIDLKSSQIESV